MASLCEGGNESTGFLKAICNVVGSWMSSKDAHFSIRSFLGHFYPPFDFLAAAHVTAYSTPQVFEAVHLLFCII
ncbi:hypothetical protein ANN_16959 [Periplaneta americana]|uniref:Uncharacterized protein n=1 Tax=Periplaneta americana TaxID=6978 RepID=A0ABQ8SRK1_PERAM|nr:hypothetical protein ANN_16959 [Periplaneta americana]